MSDFARVIVLLIIILIFGCFFVCISTASKVFFFLLLSHLISYRFFFLNYPHQWPIEGDRSL